jgi:hypothetical protein
LVAITDPETNERELVINILSEWLCSYHEVLLIEIAKEEALKRGGVLAYLDHNGRLSLEPDNGRIFTGGVANIPLRNEVHMRRELRLTLASLLEKHGKEHEFIQGFNIVSEEVFNKKLKAVESDREILKEIAKDVTLTTEEEGIVSRKSKKEDEIKIAKSKELVSSMIKKGFLSQPTSISYQKQFSYLTDRQHRYTDSTIHGLLRPLESDDVEVYAAQQPLVRGELEEGAQARFIEALQAIFQSGKTTVMPVEMSQESLSVRDYNRIVGIHWNGLFIKRVDDHFEVEIIDSAYSPEEDTEITPTSANIPPDKLRLYQLIQQAAEESNIAIRVCLLATKQQSGDLDCGPWTVDNLTRRAQDLRPQTRGEISGDELRATHDVFYHDCIREQRIFASL